MRRDQMEDLAKLYAPRAADAVRKRDWIQAAALLLERCQELDTALQSLSPGGREYVGDPEALLAVVREKIANAPRRS